MLSLLLKFWKKLKVFNCFSKFVDNLGEVNLDVIKLSESPGTCIKTVFDKKNKSNIVYKMG
mgnify:CR=1 FL=1